MATLTMATLTTATLTTATLAMATLAMLTALYFPLRRGSGPLAELPTGGASPSQGK